MSQTIKGLKRINKTPCKDCKHKPDNEPLVMLDSNGFCEVFRYNPVNDIVIIDNIIEERCIRFNN